MATGRWDRAKTLTDVLAETLPPSRGAASVVVLTDDPDGRTARDVRTTVQSLDARAKVFVADPSSAVDVLKSQSRPDVIVDLASPGGSTALFEKVFWALRDGGTYVSAGSAGRWARGVRSLRVQADGGSIASRRARQELIDSTGEPTRGRGVAWVHKSMDHFVIVRHLEVEAVLAERDGDGWGRVIARQDAHDYASRAGLVMHGEPALGSKPEVISVPELMVREYTDAVCHPREIATRQNVVLPDTYRHWQNTHLFHKRIQGATSHFGRLVGEAADTELRHEEGVFFSLDSAFPTHFGHLMTETISKVWGWRHALARHPDVRPVMTHQAGKRALPSWKAGVLDALDIPTDQVLFVEPGESVHVDALVAAMPQLVNPRYVDDGIRQTWEQIGRGVGTSPTAERPAEKIFLSRRRQSQRVCSNTPEVEAFFETMGFTIVLPEKLDFSEQVRIFSGARIIAGFGGSALFNAMFNPTAKIIVLTSRSYVAANEYLIASANGNEIHYFWAPATVEQPDSGFSTEAYRSGFEFPLREHQDALRAVCR